MLNHARDSMNVASLAMVSKAMWGVAPISWVSAATILIDQALNDYEVVWAASGHPHAVYPTSFTELVANTGATPMVVGD